MRRWLTIILLLVWVGIAGAQTTPPMCSITGNVANADGSPYIGVIKFYNPIVQVINTIPINPMQVSTGTTPTGVIQPISLPQGAFFQVTLCPSASAASGCAATFTAIVPAALSANFGQMAQGTNLSGSGSVGNLSVTGNLAVGGTSSFTGSMTHPDGSVWSTSGLNQLTVTGPTTFTGSLNFPDGSTYTTAGHNNMKALGIGLPAPPTAGQLLLSAPGGSSSILFGSATTPYGSIGAQSGNLSLAGGAHAGAGNWIADSTGATLVAAQTNGYVDFYSATGLTPGNPITWTHVANVMAAPGGGFNILTGNLYFNWVALQASNLSDFATATYTPVLAFGGSSTGITYNTASGSYVKIGGLVSVDVVMIITSKGTSTGSATISLPYVARGGISPGCQLGYYYMPGFTSPPTFDVGGGGSAVGIGMLTPTIYTASTNANWTGSENIQFNCTYLM